MTTKKESMGKHSITEEFRNEASRSAKTEEP
jgi:hypothetical protein